MYSSIPLCEFVLYGNSFKVDSQKEEILITKPVSPQTEYILWIQDFSGNRKQGIPMTDYYKDVTYFAGYTMTSFRTDHVDFYMQYLGNKDEYFYHYIPEENILSPVFKLQNPGDFSFVFINELPGQFIISQTKDMGIGNDLTPTTQVIIDKKTLRGFYFTGFELSSGIVFNEYGATTRMLGPYFTILNFGSDIITKIKSVNTSTLSNEQKKELLDLKSYWKVKIKMMIPVG